MNKSHLITGAVCILIGVVFASQIRSLPVLNKLPSA